MFITFISRLLNFSFLLIFFFCILRKFNCSFIWLFLLYLTQLKCPFLLLRSSLAQIYLFSKFDCFVCILRNLNVLFFIVTFVTRANLTVVSLNCCVCIMHKLAVLSFHCYFSISRKFSCSFLRLVFTQAAPVLHQIFYDY